MRRAIWKLITVDDSYILIKDVGPWDVNPSITNDAENVVKEVCNTGYIGDRKLFYVDSEGDVARLMMDGGKFTGFSFEDLPARTVPAKDYVVDPIPATPRDDHAFWNAFRKTNPSWKGDVGND